MKIRKATKQDWDKIVQLHKEQPFEYKLPDRSEFVDIQVVVEGKEILMVLGAKKVIEYNLILKPESKLSPFVKWNLIKRLVKKSFVNVKKKGFNQVFCWLPPEILKSFGRRMKRLGGTQFTWSVFGRSL